MKMLKITPSLPAKSFAELESLIVALKGDIEEIQIDIVDGQFVKSVSWPFTEADHHSELMKLLDLAKSVSIEMDCMVLEPQQYFDIFYELGVKKVVLHYGSTPDLAFAISELKEHKIEVGLAFTNDIPLNNIEPFIGLVDYLQVMGIAEVGQQGQPFDLRTLDTVKQLKEQYPELLIAVDGSVNESTVVALRDAGVNRFLPGSAVAKADDPKNALSSLRLLLNDH